MKILYITLSSIESNSSAMIRNNALIEGLVSLGHKVDLVTIPNQSNNSFMDNTISWSNKIRVYELNKNPLYTSLVKDTGGTILAKIKKFLLPLLRKVYHKLNIYDNTIYIAKNANHSILKEKYYDLIISSSDPKTSHIAAKKIIDSGLQYSKWIQYWGDPLTLDITNKTIYPKFILRKVEENIFSKADNIVYVSPFTYDKQMKLFKKYKNKFQFIPIPYRETKIYNKNTDKDKISLGYFGDYKTPVRNIKELYKACNENEINLTIAGNSDLQLSNSDTINILPRISQKELEDYEEKVDILVCILNRKGTQIPGKLYHYAGTNKRILVIVDGENKKDMIKYLTSFNRFIVCENNSVSIIKAVREIVQTNSKEFPSPAPEFHPKNIAKQFINLI